MKRMDFDNAIRALRRQKGEAVRAIAAEQASIKEEIALKQRMISDAHKDIAKLRNQLQGCHLRRLQLEDAWGKKIDDFIRENEGSTTSNLSEASVLNIMYELRRRGYKGIVSLPDTDNEGETLESYDLDKTEWGGARISLELRVESLYLQVA